MLLARAIRLDVAVTTTVNTWWRWREIFRQTANWRDPADSSRSEGGHWALGLLVKMIHLPLKEKEKTTNKTQTTLEQDRESGQIKRQNKKRVTGFIYWTMLPPSSTYYSARFCVQTPTTLSEKELDLFGHRDDFQKRKASTAAFHDGEICLKRYRGRLADGLLASIIIHLFFYSVSGNAEISSWFFLIFYMNSSTLSRSFRSRNWSSDAIRKHDPDPSLTSLLTM